MELSFINLRLEQVLLRLRCTSLELQPGLGRKDDWAPEVLLAHQSVFSTVDPLASLCSQ
jgi:hypothetical protein